MLSYSEMHFLLPEIAKGIIGKSLRGFMQINQTSYVFAFSNTQVFLCVEKPFSRFHLTNTQHKRYPSIFADQVHKLLQEKVCTEIFLLSEDRILCLRFEKYYFIAELMYHQPILAVTDLLFAIVLSNKPTSSPYKSPAIKPVIQHPVVAVTSSEIEKRYQLLEKEAALEQYQRKITSQIAKLKRQCKSYQEEYMQAKEWQILQNETELLKSYLQQVTPGMRSVQVMDWEKQAFIEIALDPALSIQNQLQARFKKVRKMKKRLEIYPKFIQEIYQKIAALQKELSNPEKYLPIYNPLQVSSKKEIAKKTCFHTFITDAGYTVLVGKKAKDNQKLTFTIANGNDTWLHVTPMAGSHVIIKNKRMQIDECTLQDAMQLALYFSQARKQAYAEVLVTEVKYVSRTKTIGKVLVAKYKTKKVQLDLDRIKELHKKRVEKS